MCSDVDLEGEGQLGWPFDGWPVSQIDGWCGTLLDDGDILDLDVDVGAASQGRIVLPETVVEEEVDQGDGHAGKVHPVPGVEQLVDHSSAR